MDRYMIHSKSKHKFISDYFDFCKAYCVLFVILHFETLLLIFWAVPSSYTNRVDSKKSATKSTHLSVKFHLLKLSQSVKHRNSELTWNPWLGQNLAYGRCSLKLLYCCKQLALSGPICLLLSVSRCQCFIFALLYFAHKLEESWNPSKATEGSEKLVNLATKAQSWQHCL